MEPVAKRPPIKPILFPRDPANRGDGRHLSPEEVGPFLLRYFPKYMNDLEIDIPKGPLNVRLKHVKLIRSIYWDNRKNPQSNYWRLFVANKIKTTQCFKSQSDGRYRPTFSRNFFRQQKLFSGRLELSLNPSEKDSASELHYLKRTCSHLGILNNLQLLELFINDPKFLPILAKVNKKERILSHLQILSLVFTWPGSQSYQYFQALLNCKNVLKYLRYLDLDTLAHKEFFQIFRLLPKNCPQLQGLEFSTAPLKDTCLENENYLECLQDFPTLKRLHIISCESLTFLQNAKLPISLQSLRLEFQQINWENDENMTSFHHSLRNLTNLKILYLLLSQGSDDEPPRSEKILQARKSFIEGFLKNIPRLTRLGIVFSRRPYFQLEPSTDPVPFDLFNFLACFSHLEDFLEEIDIEDTLGFFNFTCESNLPSFTKLKHLSIAGKISGLEPVLGLALNVELDKIIVRSLKELLNVFLIMAKVKDIEKKQAKIKIDMMSFKMDEFDEAYFRENYEEVKKKMQGVDLKNINLRIAICEKRAVCTQEIESFKDIFIKLEIRRDNASYAEFYSY